MAWAAGRTIEIKMKTSKTILLAALALGISATLALAQEEGNQGPGGARPPRQGGGQGGGQRMMGGPLMAALDANHDGVIDEKEIANASAALKTLDKNGDGKLTRDELFPPRPAGQGGPRGGGPGASGAAPEKPAAK